jgi:hypothetical protein
MCAMLLGVARGRAQRRLQTEIEKVQGTIGTGRVKKRARKGD